MMKKIFSEEMIKFIKTIYKSKFNDEIAALVNEKFGTEITALNIRYLKKRLKLHSEVKNTNKGRYLLFTEEIAEFIKENVKGKTNKDLTELVNKTFKKNYTIQQIDTFKTNHHITSGTKGYFPKGHVSWNKGKKMTAEVYAKAAPTMFKKGNIPHNYRPVGSERITKDGYTEIKIAEPKLWVLKHRYIWEQTYGTIPDKHVIIFLDGDKNNITLENLACISQAESGMMQKKSLFRKNAEATKSGTIIAKIGITIKNKKEQIKNDNK